MDSTTTTKYSVTIQSIVCGATADVEGSNDEVFVVWQADGGMPMPYPAGTPQRMNTSADSDNNVVSDWVIPSGDLTLTFERELLVTLWDSQHHFVPSSAIYLASYQYTAPGFNTAYPPSETSYTMSNHNGAKYTINASAVTIAPNTGDTLQAELRPSFNAIKRALAERSPSAAPVRETDAVPEGDARLMRVLAAAVKAWRSSPEGAASRQKMKGLDVKGVHAELDNVLKGPYFAGAIQRALQRNEISLIDLSSFQCVSLGLAVSIEVIAGFYAAFGIVADVGFFTGSGGTSGAYLMAGTEDGLDIGADGLLQVGAWKLSISSIGGYYSAGVGVEIGDIEGEEVGYMSFKKDKTTEGYLVGFGIGEDYGAEEQEAYVVAFPVVSSYPVIQVDAANCLTLTRVECLNKLAQADGHDEVTMYITVDAPVGSSTTYRYPEWDDYAMGDDSGDYDIWYPGRSVKFTNSVTVTLSDGSTELASFNIGPTNFPGANHTYTTPASSNRVGVQKVSYELTALLMTLAQAQGDTMNAGETLTPGQSLWSSSGQYQLILQTDGNLVLYDTRDNNKALFASGTSGKTVTMCILQSDGNLVLYQSTTAVWSSKTNGSGGTNLQVTDGGTIVIYNAHNDAVWTQPPPPSAAN